MGPNIFVNKHARPRGDKRPVTCCYRLVGYWAPARARIHMEINLFARRSPGARDRETELLSPTRAGNTDTPHRDRDPVRFRALTVTVAAFAYGPGIVEFIDIYGDRCYPLPVAVLEETRVGHELRRCGHG